MESEPKMTFLVNSCGVTNNTAKAIIIRETHNFSLNLKICFIAIPFIPIITKSSIKHITYIQIKKLRVCSQLLLIFNISNSKLTNLVRYRHSRLIEFDPQLLQ